MRLRLCFTLSFIALLAASLASADPGISANALDTLSKNVKRYTLTNGLRVLFYKRGTAPVFAGIVATRVGGSDEVAGATGISHMLEHMAFKGTDSIGTKNYGREKVLLEELEEISNSGTPIEELPPEVQVRWNRIQEELKSLWESEQFSREFDIRGASGMNATTDKELTRYFVNLPRPSFEFWCSMEAERIRNPVMRQFYQERDVVLEERRMRSDDDPLGKLYEMLLGVAYLKHPYRNPVIGYEHDVRALTARKLEEFHRKYYVPSNMVVSLVGDVDPERDLEIVERYFGAIPAADPPGRPSIVEGPQDGEREVTLEREVSPSVMIAYHKPAYPDPDDAPISVMAELFVGTKVSPLYTELVKKRRIATSVGDEEVPGSAYPNLLLFTIVPAATSSNEEVIKGFDSVLHDFQAGHFSDELLDIAKRGIAMDYLGQMKSNLSLASSLANSEILYGRWEAMIDWYAQAMKVTREDVIRTAKRYLVKESRTIGKIERKK